MLLPEASIVPRRGGRCGVSFVYREWPYKDMYVQCTSTELRNDCDCCYQKEFQPEIGLFQFHQRSLDGIPVVSFECL